MQISIEVRYATLNKQIVMPMIIEDNLTLENVVELAYSKLVLQFKNLNLTSVAIGINGKVAKNKQVIVKAYDLVEFYQPLSIDPKQLRKIKEQRKKIYTLG